MRPDFLRGPRGKAKPRHRSFDATQPPRPGNPSARHLLRLRSRQRGQNPPRGGAIIDRFLILFALMLSALILADLTLHDGTVLLFLSRELLDLVDYLVFWR